MFQGGLEMH